MIFRSTHHCGFLNLEPAKHVTNRCKYLLPDRPAAGYRHCMDDGGQRGRVSGGFYRSTGRRGPLVHHETVVPINRDGKRAACWRP